MSEVWQVVVTFAIEQEDVVLARLERRVIGCTCLPRHVQVGAVVLPIDVEQDMAICAASPLIASQNVDSIRLYRLTFYATIQSLWLLHGHLV